MRHHPPVSIRRLATGLVAVPALLLAGLAVPSLAASASPAAATTAQDTAAAAAASAQPAVGDPRDDTSFLSGPLTVHSGEYLVVDAGVTLFATRDAAAYQATGKAVCGSIG
jgi:polygalacturonase